MTTFDTDDKDICIYIYGFIYSLYIPINLKNKNQ